MTRVGSVDHVLLLLRNTLEAADRSKPPAPAAKADTSTPLDRVRALTALKSLNEEDRRRVVVRGLLATQFGDAVANDPGFERVVAHVARMIGEDAEGAALIARALEELGA